MILVGTNQFDPENNWLELFRSTQFVEPHLMDPIIFGREKVTKPVDETFRV